MEAQNCVSLSVVCDLTNCEALFWLCGGLPVVPPGADDDGQGRKRGWAQQVPPTHGGIFVYSAHWVGTF